MKTVRHALCALMVVAFLLVAPSVRATAFSTDQSDLFYISSENGWGMQLVQRGQTIFSTLFVYDQNNASTWFVATMNPTATAFVWTGNLYATTGPWFGTVPFDPNLVTVTLVGTMTWTATSVATGNVTYTVNGVTVSKDVTRQTLVFDDLSGTYIGAIHVNSSGCANPAFNGTAEYYGVSVIIQNGQNTNLNFTGANGANYAVVGTDLSQDGQFGAFNATYSSSIGEVGTASFFEINVQFNGITARFNLASTNDGCQSTGYIGGIRSQP